jgi:hypothetical protein
MKINLDITAQVIVTLVSALIAALALFLAWRQARERQLRKDEVLRWALEAIRQLQTLYLVSFLGEPAFDKSQIKNLLAQIAVETSILVEQGRLFFRNTPHETYGKDRHLAYRGYRPVLLDPIVVAHQISCQWEGATEDERQRMTLVAEDCVKRFVSLAQLEVGRSITAHEDAGKKGEGEKLEILLAKLDPERLAALQASARLSL